MGFKSFDEVYVPINDSFTVGEKSDEFESIKHLHPRFAFDFVSWKSSVFCFNSENLGVRDYAKLIKAFKDISSQTYETMNREHRFHFHEIQWGEVEASKADFIKCIYQNKKEYLSEEDDITASQFKVYEEARIIGFIYQGIFYLVMFDRGHNAYKRKDRKKR